VAEERPDRLFVALDVPDDVRDLVDHAVEPVRARYPKARWVAVEDQHVTVKFLGATPGERLRSVIACIEDVATRHPAFTTRASRLGAFPSPRRARVLWAGLDDGRGRCAAIARDLDETLAPEFPAEMRGFTPHLTVARFDPAVPLEEDVTSLAVESRVFEIDQLTLYRSHLGKPSPRYEPFIRVPLGV
jgi:RNA 2',3'-cyclic 3'-phosphodiesterase